MLRIGLSRWLSLLGASPVAISLGLSLFLLSPSVSAQTAEQLEKQYGREAMQKALETKYLTTSTASISTSIRRRSGPRQSRCSTTSRRCSRTSRCGG